jgi:hypothetical protein
MATPPSFTAGSVLTAAQMNAVGLWLVKSQAVGTGVSSVTVTGAFSADYDSYRIIYTGGLGNNAQGINMTLGSTTTGNLYQYVLSYVSYSGVGTNAGSTGTNSWAFLGESNTNTNLVCMDIHNPFLALYTLFSSQYLGSVAGYSAGQLVNTTSYTGFTLSVAGTMTGGTISVYGYRK